MPPKLTPDGDVKRRTSPRYLIRGIADAELDPEFADQIRRIRRRNRVVRYELGRLSRAVDRYALDETLPRRRDVLFMIRELLERIRKLTVELYPFSLCPACDGSGDADCICRGSWWVSRDQYWRWRKTRDPLPEPVNPNLLDEP